MFCGDSFLFLVEDVVKVSCNCAALGFVVVVEKEAERAHVLIVRIYQERGDGSGNIEKQRQGG